MELHAVVVAVAGISLPEKSHILGIVPEFLDVAGVAADIGDKVGIRCDSHDSLDGEVGVLLTRTLEVVGAEPGCPDSDPRRGNSLPMS